MRVFLLVISIVLVLGVAAGCGQASVPVTLNDLLTTPEQYSGKTVTVEGIYVRSWEWNMLTEQITFAGNAKNQELVPSAKAVWFAGVLPQEIQDRLYKYINWAGDPTRYARFRVTGKFETGKYGPMNRYKSRVTAEKIEWLDWTPPQP
jgi:hypothetical protein